VDLGEHVASLGEIPPEVNAQVDVSPGKQAIVAPVKVEAPFGPRNTVGAPVRDIMLRPLNTGAALDGYPLQRL
jgi:hypothetical protein